MATTNSHDEELELPDGLEARCRRSYDWDPSYAAKAVTAYRHFMKLKLLNEDWNATILSPSTTVDKVWHQHILGVAQYIRACEQYCGRLIDHNPEGGLNPQARKARITTTKACLKTLLGPDGVDAFVWFGDEDDDEEEEEIQDGNRTNRRRVTVADIVQVKLKFNCLNVNVGNGRRKFSLTCNKQDKLEVALIRLITPETIKDLDFWYKNTQVKQNDTPGSMLPSDDTVICPLVEGEIRQGLPITVTRRRFDSAPNRNEPLSLRVRDQTGEETFFKIYKNSTRMVKVFALYAQRKGVSPNSLRFLLDGEKVEPWETSINLDLYDQDQMDCMLEQSGC